MGKIRITGISASAGIAKGRTISIKSTKDLHKIQPGAIVILKNSTPLMVPFLAKAKGLVGEQASILCHLAIVARELNIPCVVGLKRAQEKIPDGSTLEIDGTLGEVYLYD